MEEIKKARGGAGAAEEEGALGGERRPASWGTGDGLVAAAMRCQDS